MNEDERDWEHKQGGVEGSQEGGKNGGGGVFCGAVDEGV